METTLAVIPINWKYLSVSFSAGPMIHWMNSPERKSKHFENVLVFLLLALCIDIMMTMAMTMMIKTKKMILRLSNTEISHLVDIADKVDWSL